MFSQTIESSVARVEGKRALGCGLAGQSICTFIAAHIRMSRTEYSPKLCRLNWVAVVVQSAWSVPMNILARVLIDSVRKTSRVMA